MSSYDMFFCISVDVFASGVWPLESNLEDSGTQAAGQSFASYSSEVHSSLSQRSISEVENMFTVQDIYLVLYLQHLSESIQS